MYSRVVGREPDVSETPTIMALCDSETSVSLRTTQRYTPEDLTLHSHRPDHLKPRFSFRVEQSVEWDLTGETEVLAEP
jgi:hypothetical protein